MHGAHGGRGTRAGAHGALAAHIAAPLTVLLAGAIDKYFGEPPTAVHPVAGLGAVIGALESRRPHDDPDRELAWGAGVVVATTALAAGAGWAVEARLRRTPWLVRLPLTAVALKMAFSLRGLVEAGEDVGEALTAADTDVAREKLAALVSRDRELDPPQIASAAIESMAENLTDSVLSPLVYFALAGLPGAFAYRAINTMDAMIGYRGEYEHVGKVAARADDVANYVPARVAGGILCAVAAARGRGRAALKQMWRARKISDSPNKRWTIAPMAGALGVQLEKPGVYVVGEPERPLTPAVIGEAAGIIWVAGAASIIACALLAGRRGHGAD